MSRFSDFSERKKFLVDTLDAIPKSVLVLDKNYNVVFANKHALNTHQIPQSASGGLIKCFQFSHNEESPCEGDSHVCPYKKVLQSGKIEQVTHVHYDNNGKKKTVIVTATPLFNEKKQIEYVVETSEDISTQTNLETALQSVFIGTSTEIGVGFFKSLVKNLAKVLNVKYVLLGELTTNDKIITHAVWNDNKIINNFEYDLKGTPCENVVNTSTCIYPNNIQMLFPEDELLVDMGAVSYIGTPLTDSDGRSNGVLAVLDVQPIFNDDLTTQLLSVFAARAGAELGRKRSEEKQKELEVQLIQAQKIESLGTLAGGIAHDFNNLLGAIIGYSDIAKNSLHQVQSVDTYLDKILEAGHRAKELVKQILLFSKKSQANNTFFDPVKTLLEVKNLLDSSLPSTIKISLDNTQNVGKIYADSTQIHQVVMNLATNAFHAMEQDGGTLTLSLKKETIVDNSLRRTIMKPGEYVLFSVKDTGIGMPQEIQDKVFEPYYTTKETGKGTGLGLAVTHGIVSRYNGYIFFDSVVNVGTTFNVYLPMVKGESTEEESIETNVSQGSGRILFVDDESNLAEIGKINLELSGYEVHVFTDSEVALKEFRNNPNKFDVIVTDETMPKLKGSDLAKKILAIKKEQPIIIATGYHEASTSELIHSIGIKNILLKPYSKEELVQSVNDILNIF